MKKIQYFLLLSIINFCLAIVPSQNSNPSIDQAINNLGQEFTRYLAQAEQRQGQQQQSSQGLPNQLQSGRLQLLLGRQRNFNSMQRS